MSRLTPRLPTLLLQRLLSLLLCLFLADPGLAGMDADGERAAGFSQASLLDPGLLLEADGLEGDDSKNLMDLAAAPPRLAPALALARPDKGPGQTSSRLRAHPPRAPPQA